MCQWQQPADAEMHLNQLNCYTRGDPEVRGHPL